MLDTASVKENFGGAAAHYDAHAHVQRVVRGHCLQLAKGCFKPDAQILDIGSGTGAFAQEVKAAGCNWKVTNLDIAYGMCAVSAVSNAVVNASAEALPIKAACVDGIVSSLMLQWVNTPGVAFAEMARILKPGGQAVIATLTDGTLAELRRAFETVDDKPHVSDFAAPHTLLEYANTSGLQLISARQMPLVEHYPDTIALMRGLQAIGANNKHAARRRGMMTPRQFTRLEQAYPRSRQGLPATWQVLFLTLRKM